MKKYDSITKEFLYNEYIINEKPTRKIAKEIGCYHSLILYYLVKYGIPRRSKQELNKGKNSSRYVDGRFSKQYFCIDCGKKVSYQTGFNGKGRCWSCHCEFNRGGNHHSWQGGITPLYNILHNIEQYKKWHMECLKKDWFRCQICESRKKLVVHHKNPFKKLYANFLKEYSQFSPIEDRETLVRLAIKYKPFWAINNGITYCDRHHKIIEVEIRRKNKLILEVTKT